MRNLTTMHNPPHPGEVRREWLTDITVTEAALWLAMQQDFDLWHAERELADELRNIHKAAA